MEQGVEFIIQGRKTTTLDIETVKSLIISNPSWNRTRLSKELCVLWDWRRLGGELKDIACRSFLRKLEQLGYIQLPKGVHKVHKNHNPTRRSYVEPVLHSRIPVTSSLSPLYPIEVQLVEKGYSLELFKYYISAYHYLGWSGTVGENLKYMFFDVHERPLGCLMFGAAAWKVKPRDMYIGWTREQRMKNLSYVVNNNRFLILPWVRVPYLASHILGKIGKRISRDWEKKYHHPIYLLETFVESNRFQGTCYKAANWIHVGQTQGRGKQDIDNLYLLPVKDIWLYPLEVSFKDKLRDERMSDER